MNTKYGKLTDGQIVYAPNSLDTDAGKLMNPAEASYLAAGWKKVIDELPAPNEGCTVEPSGWTETDTTLTRVYKHVAMPTSAPDAGDDGGSTPSGGGRDSDMPPTPPPVGKRIFSKLKVVIALKEANLWVLTKTWIEENGLYDHYLAAQNFAEDNEFFLRGKNELQQLAQLTDEQIETILVGCVAD